MITRNFRLFKYINLHLPNQNPIKLLICHSLIPVKPCANTTNTTTQQQQKNE